MSTTKAPLELVSPLMHEAFKARIPDRELYQLPRGWFHTSSGPVYGRVPVRPGDNDLLHQHDGIPIGLQIKFHGRVLDSDGRGVPNTLIEIWQANAGGRYMDEMCDRPWLPIDPNFTGTGRCLTDNNGYYSFLTIRPSGYAGPGGGVAMLRSAHIHFSLFGPNLSNRLVTAAYFEGDPLLSSDFVLNQQLAQGRKDLCIAKFDPENTGTPNGPNLQVGYRWDIVLRGPAATPME